MQFLSGISLLLGLALETSARDIKNHLEPFVLAVVPTQSIPAQPAAYLGVDYNYINDDRDFGLALAAYDVTVTNFATYLRLINGYLSTEFVPDDTNGETWNATVPKPGEFLRLSGRAPKIMHSAMDIVHDRHGTFLGVHGELHKTWYTCIGPDTFPILTYKAHHRQNCTATYLAVQAQPTFPPFPCIPAGSCS